jgi:hypothetical protein
LPGVLAANRQLMGADLRVQGISAQIKRPHPERDTRRRELREPDGIGWHRAMRPRWAHFPDERDPSLLNSALFVDWQADEELRCLLGRPSYRGQEPVAGDN